jgi:hypothetical protein
MSDKPDDIPQDVRNIANSIAWDLPARVARVNREFASNVISRAILAERKRCAGIAKAIRSQVLYAHQHERAYVAECIERAILTQ